MNRHRVRLSVALLAVALAGLGVFAFSAWQDAFGSDASVASARDGALEAARTEVATLASLDYRKADANLEQWSAVATGAYKANLDRAKESDANQAKRTKSVSTARITSAAVTKVDVNAGTATVILSADVHIAANGKPAVRRKAGFTARMDRTDSGWLVGDLSSTGTGTP
ncbi:hypothetical protein [Sciscionella marina]|uniref:hypothetical protein n=1 Tax=Sciscionella marina TaxID=508770 RepID=UPI000365BFAB|nr:hypothetical protein [Sciscionella marina]